MADWYLYPYNWSGGVNGTGDLIKYSSYLVGDWLGYGIILLIWLTTFGLSMILGARKALLASSFISFIFSIYLFRMGILNPVVPIVLILLTIIGAIGSKEEVSY